MKGEIYKLLDKITGKGVLPVTVTDAIKHGCKTLSTIINELSNDEREYLYLSTLINGDFSTILKSSHYCDYIINSNRSVVCRDLILIPRVGLEIHLQIPDGYKVKFLTSERADYGGIQSSWLTGDTTFIFPESARYYWFCIQKINNAIITPTEVTELFNRKYLIIDYKKFDKGDVVTQNQEQLRKFIAYNLKYAGGSDYHSIFGESFVCTHTSDIHGDAYRTRRFFKLTEDIKADAGFVTGDSVGQTAYNGEGFLFDLSPDTPICKCIGNHDITVTDNSTQAYNNCIADFANKYSYIANQKTYYYRDFIDKKIRVIALDIYEGGQPAATYNYCRISNTQINWFINTLSSTPVDYGVLVIMHAPEKAVMNNTFGFLAEHRPFLGYHTQLTGNPISKIIDAFIGKTTVSGSYTQRASLGSATTETISYNADFSNINNGVEFIAYLTGHEHSDGIGYYENTTHRQLMLNVCTAMALYGTTTGSLAYPNMANLSDVPKTDYGACQDSYNVYLFDRKIKKVIITRIGSTWVGCNYNVKREFAEIPYTD